MATPELNAASVAWIVQNVEDYIRQQRELFRPQAVPLTAEQRKEILPYFAAPILDSARTCVAAQRIPNPPFYPALVDMGFAQASLPDFSQMAAFSFIDTVVGNEPITDSTLFHELVHAVQYEKLGVHDFAVKYVQGFLTGGSYEVIPLERNAYALQEDFELSAFGGPFAVADRVQEWIDQGKF